MPKNIHWDIKKLAAQDFQKPDPDTYLIDEALSAALRVAVALGQPLLITGKAGTGKTQLAHKAAAEFSRQDPTFLKAPIEFHTKSSSIAKDLLYSYDAVRHFHDAGVRSAAQKDAPEVDAYIALQALGRAILLSHPNDQRGVFKDRLTEKVKVVENGKVKVDAYGKDIEIDQIIKEARSSVVLIDEIDKAPRDFPNDLLHEINRYEFRINEIPGSPPFARNPAQRIVVILTSNSDKNLPEAFLRRCVFYHIPEPDGPRLKEILAMHFAAELLGNAIAQQFLIDHFLQIADKVTGKKPATAELINWFRILEIDGLIPHIERAKGRYDQLDPAHQALLKQSLSVVVKTPEDLDHARKLIQDPLKTKA